MQIFDESRFDDVVSGRRRGIAASLTRTALAAASLPYGLAVELRNRAYDAGWFRAMRLPVPVVSVGNLTLGGTGKTPLVHYIARWFQLAGIRVVVLSRGYKARRGEPNDEARMFADQLPGVPYLADRDRVRAGRWAVERHAAQVLVLDDGLQHRGLARDLEIVVLDGLQPFGHGRLFPRGLLREPRSALGRADLVVLSRADLCSPALRCHVRTIAERARTGIGWVETAHRPTGFRNATGLRTDLQWLDGRTVAAFCGIGNPEGFRGTLRRLGCRVVAFHGLPDHYRYDRGQLDRLARWAERVPAEAFVTTHKDLVKLACDTFAGRPLWALDVELELISDPQPLETALQRMSVQCRSATAAPGADMSQPHFAFGATPKTTRRVSL